MIARKQHGEQHGGRNAPLRGKVGSEFET